MYGTEYGVHGVRHVSLPCQSVRYAGGRAWPDTGGTWATTGQEKTFGVPRRFAIAVGTNHRSEEQARRYPVPCLQYGTVLTLDSIQTTESGSAAQAEGRIPANRGMRDHAARSEASRTVDQ
jgi:hypothetical protein